MAQDRTDYSLHLHEAGVWRLTSDGQVLFDFEEKATAVQVGQAMAQAHWPSQLVIHGHDGEIEYEVIYQDDPFPTRG
jgi:hypothetical protein